MDVAVTGAKIARVAANIDPASARRVADATGLHVVPGLIDIHAHIFFGTEKDAYLSNADTAVQPDSHSFRSGQTTLVDAGGAGWRNFAQFKEQVIDRARFVDVSGGKLAGDRKLDCELTVKGGQVVWDLNGISRPIWTEMPK